MWGFGYGLSYSEFHYGPIKIARNTISAGEPVTVKVSVTNTSKRPGDEVVEAYLKTPQSDGPIHSLVGLSESTWKQVRPVRCPWRLPLDLCRP